MVLSLYDQTSAVTKFEELEALVNNEAENERKNNFRWKLQDIMQEKRRAEAVLKKFDEVVAVWKKDFAEGRQPTEFNSSDKYRDYDSSKACISNTLR